jgi:hypothetical protein
LPGDERGYVDNGQHFPSFPALAAAVRKSMKQPPVVFSLDERNEVFDALQLAAIEFGYQITDAVVEATHLHWIIGHSDSVADMTGRLENRIRKRLNRGRIWTDGYSHRLLFDEAALYQARQYLTKHTGLRLLAEKLCNTSPGEAGGFQL